jgi:hypothetical protein
MTALAAAPMTAALEPVTDAAVEVRGLGMI